MSNLRLSHRALSLFALLWAAQVAADETTSAAPSPSTPPAALCERPPCLPPDFRMLKPRTFRVMPPATPGGPPVLVEQTDSSAPPSPATPEPTPEPAPAAQ